MRMVFIPVATEKQLRLQTTSYCYRRVGHGPWAMGHAGVTSDLCDHKDEEGRSFRFFVIRHDDVS
jgi:hypothetical protein